MPLWLWWLEHFAWLFPWSFFVPLLSRELPRLRTWGHGMDRGAQARVLLFVWAGVVLLFFSIESGSRMEYYSLGAWPALALLLGAGIARAEEDDDRRLRWIAGALAGLGLLGAIAAGTLVRFSAHTASSSGISAHVTTHGTDFYDSSMARVLDLTPRALADLRGPLVLSSASLFAAFLTSWILRRRKRHFAATVGLALGMVGFFVAASISYRDFAPTFSSRALAERINKSLKPGDRIALYGDIRVAPGVAFYSHRRVLLYNASGSNLEFGSRYGDAPKTFWGDQDFRALWAGPGRVILVVPLDKNQEALGRLPRGSSWLLASAGGKTAYVNQAMPAGIP